MHGIGTLIVNLQHVTFQFLALLISNLSFYRAVPFFHGHLTCILIRRRPWAVASVLPTRSTALWLPRPHIVSTQISRHPSCCCSCFHFSRDHSYLCSYMFLIFFLPLIDAAPKVATSQTISSSAPSASTCSTTDGTLPAPRTEEEILSSTNLKAFAFNDLKTATRNFRPNSLVGEGGFGYVYKGWIDEQSFAPARPISGMMVAVKKLKPEGSQGHKEWLVRRWTHRCDCIVPLPPKKLLPLTFLMVQAEVNYLGQLRHPQLVRLIGYCLEGDNRLLVYEFVPRGSLENHLFRST